VYRLSSTLKHEEPGTPVALAPDHEERVRSHGSDTADPPFKHGKRVRVTQTLAFDAIAQYDRPASGKRRGAQSRPISSA
jgi:hypothetical protein